MRIIILFLFLIVFPLVEATSIGVSPPEINMGAVEYSQTYPLDITLINPEGKNATALIETTSGLEINIEEIILEPYEIKKVTLEVTLLPTATDNEKLIISTSLLKHPQNVNMNPAISINLKYDLPKESQEIPLKSAAVRQTSQINEKSSKPSKPLTITGVHTGEESIIPELLISLSALVIISSITALTRKKRRKTDHKLDEWCNPRLMSRHRIVDMIVRLLYQLYRRHIRRFSTKI